MIGWLLRRIGQALLVVLAMTVIVFVSRSTFVMMTWTYTPPLV